MIAVNVTKRLDTAEGSINAHFELDDHTMVSF